MKQKLLFSILFLTLILSTTISFAQTEFDLPQDIELKTKEDYTRFEGTLVEAAKWLEQTDLDKEIEKRKLVNAFVLQWVTGSSTVTVDIGTQLAKIYGKDFQLLGLYLASYAKDVIENKSLSNKFTATKAGLTSIMNVYKKGIQVSKNKELDKIIKLTDGELDGYIISKFKLPKTI